MTADYPFRSDDSPEVIVKALPPCTIIGDTLSKLKDESEKTVVRPPKTSWSNVGMFPPSNPKGESDVNCDNTQDTSFNHSEPLDVT